jgi:acetoin utilization deacetylase AcuC-like enzyme
LNDLAIAARVIQKLGLAKKILIVDLDVHQGDGTAFIFENDNSIFTFSMHCEINFPGKDSGGGVLTSVIGEAEYTSYGKEAGTKTRQRDIEAVGNTATGRNHY